MRRPLRGAVISARATRRLAVLVSVLAFLAVAGVAQANAYTEQDANDVAGPLDIRSASHSHAGAKLVHTIRTFAGWGVGILGPRTPNYFLLELNTDSDRPPERSIIVFSRNGRLVASVFGPGPRRRYLGTVPARHPNRKMLRIVVPRKRLGNPAGYQWQAFAFYKSKHACKTGCFDRAPNGGADKRVLHDIRAPRIVFPPPPAPAAGTTDYTLDFTVTDAGGSGLDIWQLQQRDAPGQPWVDVAADSTLGAQSVPFSAVALGDSDQFRVRAVDQHRNVRISPIRTVLTKP